MKLFKLCQWLVVGSLIGIALGNIFHGSLPEKTSAPTVAPFTLITTRAPVERVLGQDKVKAIQVGALEDLAELAILAPMYRYAQVAETDPAAALNILMQEGDTPLRENLFPVLLRFLADVDWAAALAYVEELQDPLLSQGLRLMAGCCANPKESFVLRLRADNPDVDSEKWRQMWDTVSRDPEAVDCEETEIHALLTQLAVHKLSEDREKAVAWALKLPGGHARAIGLRSILSSLVTRDYDEALRLVRDNVIIKKTPYALEGLVEGASRTDPVGILDWIYEEAGDRKRTQLVDTLMTALIDIEPAVAADLGERIALRESYGLEKYVGRLAELDPAKALDWVRRVGGGQSEMAVMGERWAMMDPEAAIAALSTIEDGHRRMGFARGLAAGLASRDPMEGLRYVQSLEPEAADAGWEGLLRVWGRTAPTEAAEVVRQMDPAQKIQGADLLTRAWALDDPAAAADWLGNLEDSTQMIRATQNVVEAWSQIDPLETSRWLRTLPAGHAAERGSTVLAKEVLRYAPELAMEWTLMTASDDMRPRNVTALLGQWARVHGTEAALEEAVRQREILGENYYARALERIAFDADTPGGGIPDYGY